MYTPLVGSMNNVISPLGADLIHMASTTGASLKYITMGTAPNRVCVTQWLHYSYYVSSGDLNFQIWLYENSGSIRFNDELTEDIGFEVIRDKIAVVLQQPILFNDTLRHNLTLGGNFDEMSLWRALEVAQAKDFVEALPEKLDAPVAQGGTNFSGGQRQRLAITRALVRKPEIYLLDDSFSALDYTTDAKLRNALHTYAAHSTLIVIAQRVSTILAADQIVVLDEGKVVGVGTHKELMQNCSTYKEIVLSQLSPEEAA